MLTKETIRDIALSFPDTDEQLQLDLIHFRVNKKFFASLNMAMKRCTLKFSAEYQDIFISIGKGKIYAVPNAWGRLGWTTFELPTLKKEFIKDAFLHSLERNCSKKISKIISGVV
jgi:hypothetical protein